MNNHVHVEYSWVLLHLFNFLDLPPAPSRDDVFRCAQNRTFLLAGFCRECRLPPEVVTDFFGVKQSCSNYDQAALLAAQNLVEAYYEGLGGGFL